MIHRFIIKMLFLLMLPSLSYGVGDKENIDLDKYHKLKTSSIYFSSVKEELLSVGVGFYKSHREMYFRGKISHKKILGFMTIHSLDRKNKPIKIYLKEGYWVDVWMNDPIQNIYFIMDGVPGLKAGDYLIVPEIYVAQDIPSTLDNVVMVREKATLN